MRRSSTATKAWLQEQQPDLVIVSGDFTQRARVEQFRRRRPGSTGCARPAGRCSPCPAITTSRSTTSSRRFAAPLRRYKRYISSDLCPWFENDEVGRARDQHRPFAHLQGRPDQPRADGADRGQVRRGARRKRPGSSSPTILLFAMPIGEGTELSEAVGRHEDAVKAVCRAGVNVALAGHFHRTYAAAARKMVEDGRRSARHPGGNRDVEPAAQQRAAELQLDPRPPE